MRRLVLATMVCAAWGLSGCFTVLLSAEPAAKAAELAGQPSAELFSEGFAGRRKTSLLHSLSPTRLSSGRRAMD